MAADGTLDAGLAELQADPRTVAAACAMRRERGGGDACSAGPASPGPALAFGATPLEFLRWAATKGTAPAAARAGGRGWTDRRLGLLDCDGPPGTMTQVMAGVALSFRQRGQARAALVFEDRLALETGRWHEGMSFAAALKAPLIVVLVPAASRRARDGDDDIDTAAVAANYGLEALSLDDQSPARVQEMVADARRRAIEGNGPSLFEMTTWADADEDWDSLGSDATDDDQALQVRQAKRAATTAVEFAVTQLRMEPGPASQQALASVLHGEPSLPSWTRRDPPDPADRLPPPSKSDEHAFLHG